MVTSRQAAVAKAKDCYWLMSRHGKSSSGFTSTAGGWVWQGESFDGVEWRVMLKNNGALNSTARLSESKKSKPTIGWDTTSIDGMERTAKNEADRNCNVKIRDHWLEVFWTPTAAGNGTGKFSYKWGKNYVTRGTAMNVLATRDDAQ
jgi:hypothetical protein